MTRNKTKRAEACMRRVRPVYLLPGQTGQFKRSTFTAGKLAD
ncbi:Unknown protein sequence [Pseudomonas amygdali pv. morsprunorum]|uniref:Uncharacterized protein n=1 Tax=Pseudomonas meliae TaxID=86176 RepID=A0A0P9V5S2_9PSED|nr:Unknown protein sequence [Pseudomonas amygdali pv. morsprunorum]KPX93435.1 hypothetical protein ALO64_100719 [Pseudomonas meliae]